MKLDIKMLNESLKEYKKDYIYNCSFNDKESEYLFYEKKLLRKWIEKLETIIKKLETIKKKGK